ncbi:MAG: pyruvate kinase [Nitrosomonadales bacterium]
MGWPGNQERVGLDYKELPNDVSSGSILLLNDGMLEFDVTEVKGSEIICKVVRGGVLSNNKGINRKGGGANGTGLDRERQGRHQDGSPDQSRFSGSVPFRVLPMI